MMSTARFTFHGWRAHNILKVMASSNHKPLKHQVHSIKPFKVQDYTTVRKYETSFQQWILNMFSNNPNYTVIGQRMKVDLININEIKTLDFESLLNLLWSKKSEEALTPIAVRKIDEELSRRISHVTSTAQLLSSLHVFMTVIPIQAPKLNAFKSALNQLELRIKKSKMSPYELVQATYYASHLKTGIQSKKFIAVVTHNMDASSLNELSNADLGVFCLSLFRSGVPLAKPRLLEFLVDRFQNEMDVLITEEPAIFVSFVKCFRLSKYYENEMMDSIASKGMATLQQLDIVARIHLGVYFAASNYGNVEFMKDYLGSCIEEMDKIVLNGESPRLKDIDNIIWSCSVYNTQHLSNKLAESSIVNYVKDSLCLLKRDPDLLISLLLWLWICSCRLESEVVKYVSNDCSKYITDSKNFKSQANLFLLLTCVQLESHRLLKPQIIGMRDKRLQPKFEPYLNKRPCLKALLTTLQKYGEFLKLQNVKLDFIVPALYIASVSAEFKGLKLSLEVVDHAVCLTNSNHLTGKMILKLRLLQKMGIHYVMIPGSLSYEMESLKELLQAVLRDNTTLPPNRLS